MPAIDTESTAESEHIQNSKDVRLSMSIVSAPDFF